MDQFNTFVDFVLHVKGVEYLLAIGFMTMFIFFFRYLKSPAAATATAEATAGAGDRIDGIIVPASLFFHRGHAWAQALSPERARLGLDDFAQKLIGKIGKLELPAVGAILNQGQPAWTLVADGKKVSMLSPVSGKVTRINDQLSGSLDVLNSDPYGKGWLLEVEAPKNSLTANLKNLLTKVLAKKWMETSIEELMGQASGNLGLVSADGANPVNGMARNLGGENWDRLAKEFFLTEEE